MKKSLLSIAAVMLAFTGMAQNKVNLTMTDGSVESYNTADVRSIDIDDSKLTVNPVTGSAKTYQSKVAGISFVKNIAGHVQITEAGGWFETAYVKWNHFDGATNYEVYVKGGNLADWTRLDYQLVRNYGNYGRADMPGLKAGSYLMKVVPVVGGKANEAAASETSALEVRAHDRGGFAHMNYADGIGAYKNDGTLKDGAKVFYVTPETAKTITTDVVQGTTTVKPVGIQAIIAAYQKKNVVATPLVFRIIGRVTGDDLDYWGSSAEGLQIKGAVTAQPLNITIEGIGNDATVTGFGFLVRSAASIEFRNFAVMNFKDDGISLDTDNAHIWVHNLDIFYGGTGGAADQAKGDGSVDLKGDSQYITVSYNHFWDSGKSSLCGMTSESGPNWITYHHNWFDHSDSRHPRIRTMSVHVYNNYYDGVSKYGVGATTGADAFVEANYFRDCKYPILTSLQGSDIMGQGTTPNGKGTFSGEAGGSVKAYGNVMRGLYWYRPYSETSNVEFDCWEAPSRDAKMPSSIKAKSGGDTYSNWDTDSKLMYSYTPDAAEDVPAIVKGIYGAGRINHGDFKWRFNNNVQDFDYDVNSALKAAIVGYDSFLVGFYEGATKIGNGGKGFSNSGGDATEGDEYPKGDGNAAAGEVKPGGGSTSEPVEAGDIFMASADGTDYFWFNAANKAATEAFVADGTITLDAASKLRPDYTPAKSDGSWTSTYTGSIEVAKSTGVVTFKCPSVSVFQLQLARSGSFKGTIEKSVDGGKTWTNVATLSQKAGNHMLDISSSVASSTEVLVRIKNTATGGLNIHGVRIIKAKAN